MQIKPIKTILLIALCPVFLLASPGDSQIDKSAKSEKVTDNCSVEKDPDELAQLLEGSRKNQIVYSSDKKLMAHLDRRLVTVWSMEERKRLHKFILEGTSLAAAFSPDGLSLVTADGEGNLEYLSTIKIWNLATGEERLLTKFLGTTTNFAFSPDGSRLAAASNLNFIGSITRNPEDKIDTNRIQIGGSIYVWKVSDGTELLKIDIELPEYSSKLHQIRQIRTKDLDNNNNKTTTNALVAAYEDAVVKLVPVQLTFSQDGKRLITVSTSGQEKIIDSSTGKAVPE